MFHMSRAISRANAMPGMSSTKLTRTMAATARTSFSGSWVTATLLSPSKLLLPRIRAQSCTTTTERSSFPCTFYTTTTWRSTRGPLDSQGTRCANSDLEDNLEYFPVKADGAVRIAKLVQAAGLPIHGIGLQAHMTVGRTPSRENLTWTLNKYVALGLDVAYTELDVRLKPLPSNASSLEAQAKEFTYIVGSCLDGPRCVGVTVWGIGDGHSWIPQTFPGAGYAYLYDKSSKPKPAYSSVSALLASASGQRPPWTPAASTAPAAGTTATATAVKAVPTVF